MTDARVLYILGSSRCGSTVLDNVLGEMDGFFSVGELRFLWQRLLEGRRCGCGCRLTECPVWTAVLDDELLRYRRPEQQRQALRWQRDTTLLKHTPRLLLQRHNGNRPEPLQQTVRLMEALYRRIALVTGARVIVDSSKRPSNAAVMRLMPIEVHYIQLLRDPRAVVYSHTHAKPNPDGSQTGAMPALPAHVSTLQWLAIYLGIAGLRRRIPAERWMKMRYEDLVGAPRDAVEAIRDFVGQDRVSLPFVGSRTVRLGVHHTVSGNPVRFERGPVDIRADERWRSGLGGRDRIVTTTMAWPLMLAYGYGLGISAGERWASRTASTRRRRSSPRSS